MIQFWILLILSDLCSLIYFAVVAVDMTVEAIATVVVVAEDTEEVVEREFWERETNKDKKCNFIKLF